MTTITLRRRWLTPESTIGTLDVLGVRCFTLEDTRRRHKVWGETRIPAGNYRLQLRREGGMNARYEQRFPDMHRGMIWLRHVPEFEWVYIHPGNTAADTLGCILVGTAHDEDRVINSVAAYRRVYPLIAECIEEEGCRIEIIDEEYHA